MESKKETKKEYMAYFDDLVLSHEDCCDVNGGVCDGCDILKACIKEFDSKC